MTDKQTQNAQIAIVMVGKLEKKVKELEHRLEKVEVELAKKANK